MKKLASWNVNSLRVRLPHLLDWLNTHQPDILGIQETKSQDKDFPIDALKTAGYHVVFSGQKTYNGVATLSKHPIDEPVQHIPFLDDPQRRFLATTIDDIRFINVYVPNGSDLDSEKYAYKLNWLDKLKQYIKQQLRRYENVVMVGDFNIAPDERDVHDPVFWKDRILVSQPERAALQQLLDLGLHDSFRLFPQETSLFSWWDYRAAGFRRNHGLRIDLILVSDALKHRCEKSYIDIAPRKLERPSDHTPVICEIN